MATVTEMKAQLDALLKARSVGARRVEYQANGVHRLLEYRTSSELRQDIADLQNMIAQAEGRGPRVQVIHSHKGWDRTAEGV